MKYFAIRPVRNISFELEEGIKSVINHIRKEGHTVYDPLEDTNQNDMTGLRICKDNRQAIKNADVVLFIWDGNSQGCLFDLGMAFAFGKNIITIDGYIPNATSQKSFQNMVREWEHENN